VIRDRPRPGLHTNYKNQAVDLGRCGAEATKEGF